jgi:hypothetical protein
MINEIRKKEQLLNDEKRLPEKAALLMQLIVLYQSVVPKP